MRPRTLRGPAAVIAFAVVAAACAAGSGASPRASSAGQPASAPASPLASATASPTTGGGPSVDPLIVPEGVLGAIVADAAAQTGADPAELRILHAAAVEFNDGSLGCPEPGMVYTQAIVPGWQVIIEHDGTRLDYRASRSGGFRICPEGGNPLPGDR